MEEVAFEPKRRERAMLNPFKIFWKISMD